MSPQHALRGSRAGPEQHNLWTYTCAVGYDANPALLERIRQIQSGKSILSIGRPGDGDPVWQGGRPFDSHLPRLGNEAEIRLSR